MHASTLDDLRPLYREIAGRAADADAKGHLPRADVEALRDAGYLALAVPEAHGGRGASLVTCVEAQLELAKASGSTALVAGMTIHIVGSARETDPWRPWAFEALCREVAAGALLNAAASEPQLGSPSRGGLPQTAAEPDGDELIVTGHKTWVTGGEHLRHLLVRLRLGDAATTVWIPADTPGVRWEHTWGEGLSLRASDSDDLFLEAARVPRRNLIDAPEGASGPNVWFPMIMAATYLGVGLAARDAAIRYALERTPTALGRAIATLPHIQRQIGEIDVALTAARTQLLATAERWRGDPADAGRYLARAAAAKHLAVESALEATDKALRLVGAAGIDRSLPLERYFRDVRAGLMHPPSGDAALELVGRDALGL